MTFLMFQETKQYHMAPSLTISGINELKDGQGPARVMYISSHGIKVERDFHEFWQLIEFMKGYVKGYESIYYSRERKKDEEELKMKGWVDGL